MIQFQIIPLAIWFQSHTLQKFRLTLSEFCQTWNVAPIFERNLKYFFACRCRAKVIQNSFKIIAGNCKIFFWMVSDENLAFFLKKIKNWCRSFSGKSLPDKDDPRNRLSAISCTEDITMSYFKLFYCTVPDGAYWL